MQFFRHLIACIVFLTALLCVREAWAYPWMIRHGYTGCATCHADPSGGAGLLTPYGRAQGELVLRTRYGAQSEDEDPGRAAEFLFGVVPTPEPLLMGGSIRNAFFVVKPQGSPATSRFLQMQADLKSQLKIDRFRVSGSLGYNHQGSARAQVTHRTEHNLVSREHWVGADLGEDEEWLVRAGRMALPFGLRGNEHTMWTRSTVRTDLNDAQQHGAAVAYNPEGWRMELMAIAGNFQENPDRFRERGYSGYIERAFGEHAAAGLSSLVTRAARDPAYGMSLVRQAHGAFVRYAPITPIVIMAEADALIGTPDQGKTRAGAVGMLQVDTEFLQGLHASATGEVRRNTLPTSGNDVGGWLSLNWFFFSHTDMRLDGIVRNIDTPVGRITTSSFLANLHFYL